jgi:hypothetical protein
VNINPDIHQSKVHPDPKPELFKKEIEVASIKEKQWR